MYYTIYQITCNTTGKIYIGKHQTKNTDDEYMGSGKLLGYAKQKYGIKNFTKKILYIFETEEEMNQKEAELVTEDFCSREDTYNLCPGGHGGFGYIQSLKTKEQFREIAKLGRVGCDNKLFEFYGVNNPSQIDFVKAKLSKKSKDNCKTKRGGFIGENNPFYGRKHSKKTKTRFSEKAKERLSVPENNSQFGTIWITDGLESKKIKGNEIIPEGWYKGRKIKTTGLLINGF